MNGESGAATAVGDPAVAVHVQSTARWAATDAAAKRVLDVLVGALALLLLSPLLALLALLIRLDSPGPVFYRSPRVGYRGRDLRMLKFRKMHDGASGIALTLENDDRFTRIGRWLAGSKLDELPQLWHLVTGEMSVVGPRPETVGFVGHQRSGYEQILTVRPGILGWSQLAFAEEGRILDASDPLGHYLSEILPQKVALDVMYARRRTLPIDLKIAVWSALAIVAGMAVAVNRDDGELGRRRR